LCHPRTTISRNANHEKSPFLPALETKKLKMATQVTMVLALGFASVAVAASTCPIVNDTTVVYSIADGVGPASQIWVEDFLWWMKSSDDSFKYQSLTGEETASCDLSSFPNLRIFVNPGGNAYDQLTSLGADGTQNIINFVNREVFT
jgi:hypothetical protein